MLTWKSEVLAIYDMLFTMPQGMFAFGARYLPNTLQKKRSEGKHYNVAISHAAKKLVRLIFALQKSGQPYIAKS